MIAWLRDFFTDKAQFAANVRGLVAVFGAFVATLTPDALGGLGKYGNVLMAIGLFIRAGERNDKGGQS